jgi:flagellar FliJ protein
MKSFKFRLQTVLEQRERVETLAQQSLAEAEAALHRGQTLLGDLHEIRTALLEELCRLRCEGFNAEETRLYHDYLQTITQSVREQEAYVRDLTIIREAHKLHLVGAAQNRQALAGVKDRHQQAFVAQKQRIEQNTIDELATVRHTYGQRNSQG